MARENLFPNFDPYKNVSQNTNRTFNAPGVDSFLSEGPGGGDPMLPPTRQEREMRQREHEKLADEIASRNGWWEAGDRKFMPGSGKTYFTGNHAGIPQYIRASMLGNYKLKPGGGMGDDLERLLAMDSAEQQAEANAAFLRNQQEIDAMRGFVGGLDSRIMGQAKGLYDDLIGQADKLEKLGQSQYEDVMKGMPKIQKGIGEAEDLMKQRMERADADASRAYQKALEAEEYAKKTQQQYKDTSVMEASAAANGISRSFQMEEKQIASGLRPDGSQMSPQEVFQAHQELTFQKRQEIQSQMTPILARYNENYAQLGQFVSQVIMNTAQAAQNMAQQRAQIASAGLEGSLAAAQSRTSLVDRQLQAQQNQAQMSQLSAQLHRDATETAQSALFRSAELTMQGMAKTAEMVSANVRSLVSRFQGKLGLIAARRAQGGGGGGGGAVLTSTPRAPRTPFAPGGSMQGKLNFTRPRPADAQQTQAAPDQAPAPAFQQPASDKKPYVRRPPGKETGNLGNKDGQELGLYDPNFMGPQDLRGIPPELREKMLTGTLTEAEKKKVARKQREAEVIARRKEKARLRSLETSGREDMPGYDKFQDTEDLLDQVTKDLRTSSRSDMPGLTHVDNAFDDYDMTRSNELEVPSKEEERRKQVLDDVRKMEEKEKERRKDTGGKAPRPRTETILEEQERLKTGKAAPGTKPASYRPRPKYGYETVEGFDPDREMGPLTYSEKMMRKYGSGRGTFEGYERASRERRKQQQKYLDFLERLGLLNVYGPFPRSDQGY